MTNKEKALIQVRQVMKARQINTVLAVISTFMLIMGMRLFNGFVSIFCVVAWWLQGKLLASYAERWEIALDDV